MTILKVAAYSNPITAPVMLLATTMQIPVNIISSAKKCLGQAKDFVLNSIPVAQLFLFAAIGYYIFDKTSKVGHYVFDKPKATQTAEETIQVNPEATEEEKQNKLNELEINMRYDADARKALDGKNAEKQNLLQQAAQEGNVEAVKIMVNGSHSTLLATALDVAQHPVLNGADALVNVTNAVLNKVSPKLGDVLPDRTINQGATAEEINNVDNEGKTLLHIAAEKFNTEKGLEVIAKTVKKGGDLGKRDDKGDTPVVKALENKALTQEVEPKKIVKVLTENGKQITKAVAPIAQNPEKAELIKPVVEFAMGKNGVIFNRDNAEKSLADTLDNAVNANNTEVVKALIPTINNLETAEDIKAAMPELSKELEVRQEALVNPCNKNPLELLALGRGSGVKAPDVKDYIENPTVPKAHKVLAVAAVLPNAQAIINEAIIETAVSTTSKVVGWMGDFLAAVGEEMGKGLTADNGDFTANTSPINYSVAQTSSWMLQSVAQTLAIAGSENMGFDSTQLALEWVKE